MQAHICIGLGFKCRTLCKAECKSQQEARELNPEDAAEWVWELNEEWVRTTIKWKIYIELNITIQIQVESFSQDDVAYTVSVNEGSIFACDCKGFIHSCLPCKHMFLAQQVTTYNITLDQAILPSHSTHHPVEQNNQ